MDVREAFALALEMLAANRVRTALTMLGVVIGVAAIILLVSLGEGATAYITRELTGLGTNLLIITPGKTQTSGGFHPPIAGAVRKLTYEDAVALRRRATLLTDAVPVVLGTGKIRYQGASRDTNVIGVTPEFQRVRNLYVEIGQFVSEEDVEGRRRVVVLGRTVKRELFGEENPLGQFVTLADSRYRVIGIMERKGVLRHDAPWGACCTGDEGGPFGAAVQAEAPNHPKLLQPKAVVVSVRGKGVTVIMSGGGWGDERKRTTADASKAFRRHQNQTRTLGLGAAWREPGYWPCGVRCIGGVTPIWAPVWNVRTLPVMPREKAQAADPRGRKYRCAGKGRTAPE